MSMQVSKVWWDGEKLIAEPINAADVYKPEPVTEWLTCPKCNHKSPYSPIKAKTLAEDAERITKQARAALAEQAAQKRPQNCGTSHCSCIECVMEPEQHESVAWPCVIAEADFEQDTITLEMQCSDYKVGAGQHWLSTSLPAIRPLTMVEMVDAAMVATASIFPPITRSQCETIIRAAAHGIKGEQHG